MVAPSPQMNGRGMSVRAPPCPASFPPSLAPEEVVRANAQASDRPSHCPWAEQLQLHDPVVKVQFGFKTRPLRDGGGKTSPGRMPPHLRQASPLAAIGEAILDLVRPHVPAFMQSIASPCQSHPFPTQVLEEARKLMQAQDLA